MWEQIRSNKRKSVWLVMSTGLLLLALGFVIGLAVLSYAAEGDYGAGLAGGVLGMMVAFCIWLVMSLVAYFQGAQVLMSASGARAIEKADHPQLFNVVEEMTIAAGLGKMPKIYVIDDPALNAFAAGRDPDHAVVAVTRGLLGKLNRDQLQGVIAHEMSHIINRDVLFMTMMGVTLGAIVLISEVFLRGLWVSGGGRSRRSRYSGKGGGQAQAIIMVVAILFAVLAPIMGQLIYLAASRRREYLADANACVLTRYPPGLASALQVIAHDSAELSRVSRATAPMYIKNPLKGRSASSLFSTHPPIEERIRILSTISGSASFAAYQQAWNAVDGKNAGALPQSALTSSESRPIRQPQADTRAKSARKQMREAGDLLRKAHGYVFLPCACGLRVKLPPDFKKDHVACPRCHRELAVPVAQLAAMKAAADVLAPENEPAEAKQGLQVDYDGKGWKSFKCTCGAALNLSPNLKANNLQCPKCGAGITVNRVA